MQSDEVNDYVEDIKTVIAKQGPRKHRNSVSAESFILKKDFIPPVHPKTEDLRRNLVSVLTRSFVFKNLSLNDLNTVINAMMKVEVAKNDTIIK